MQSPPSDGLREHEHALAEVPRVSLLIARILAWLLPSEPLSFLTFPGDLSSFFFETETLDEFDLLAGATLTGSTLILLSTGGAGRAFLKVDSLFAPMVEALAAEITPLNTRTFARTKTKTVFIFMGYTSKAK